VLIAWVYYSAQIFLFGAGIHLGVRQPAWIAHANAAAGDKRRGAEPPVGMSDAVGAFM